MGGINGIKKAPIYFGGKSDDLFFIDSQYNRERNDFDDFVMDALIAVAIDENRCPTAGEWVHFCITSAIVTAVTGDTLIACPKTTTLKDIEELSWSRLWNIYHTGQLQFNNKNFEEAILRIFIIRQHTVDGPGRPYNMSYFVKRWGFSFGLFPDTLNDKTCNVRLQHLKKGREIFETLSYDTKIGIKLIAKFLPLILKEVNIAIKQ